MSQFFTSGDQSIEASVSVSVLPVNIQGWFPLILTGLILQLLKRPLKSLLQHHNLKASILQHSAFFMVQLSHPYMTTGKTIALAKPTRASLVAQMVKNLPTVQETQVQSLVREDPLEKEMVAHSSILAWMTPWKEEPGRLQSMGLQRFRHDSETHTFTFFDYTDLCWQSDVSAF